MKFKLFFAFCTLLILFSCNQEKKLFAINSYDELVFMATTTNVKTIDKKSESVLTVNEMLNKHRIYKDFGNIYENKQFKTHVILSEGTGKNYAFLIRTINKVDNKVINTFLLASYNEKNNEFCSGYLTSNLELNRTCELTNFKVQKKINNFGKIINLN